VRLPCLDAIDNSAIAEAEAIGFMRGITKIYSPRRGKKIYPKIGTGLLRKGIRPRRKK
jgi:hypothetical protein